MKLFSYIDDGLNYLIVNVFEKLPIWLNAILFGMVVALIFIVYEGRNKK